MTPWPAKSAVHQRMRDIKRWQRRARVAGAVIREACPSTVAEKSVYLGAKTDRDGAECGVESCNAVGARWRWNRIAMGYAACRIIHWKRNRNNMSFRYAKN